MAEFGLVADDRDLARGAAAAQECVDAVDHGGVRDARAVHLPLQLLPGQFAVRRAADRVADRPLARRNARVDQAGASRRRVKHRIVTDQRVVEIDPDASHLSFSDCMRRML
jgi:hypothetical protein